MPLQFKVCIHLFLDNCAKRCRVLWQSEQFFEMTHRTTTIVQMVQRLQEMDVVRSSGTVSIVQMLQMLLGRTSGRYWTTTDVQLVQSGETTTELENAVAVENLELQEQRSDREELEETLVKLEKHKEKLTQQIKATRQLCYEESQQILSLQAEEVKRESQVEEYERELARARWRLRKLKEEVKQAKRKMEEAGERNCPLRDSIRQSYDEILQEERTLCCVSGGAVTPESQLDGSTSPADTAEEEPLPMRPWGRSQSLPAYADLIMVASSAPFCNNLADTREEVDDSSSSSPKMDRSNLEDDPEEGVATSEEQGGLKEQSVPNKLDFYQADPFAHCQISHDLFHEDLFPKTDSSDGFTSDPFKGTDPFAADILFPEANIGRDEGAVIICDEADASLSCAENKASTGTQCFESEFPDEDSDIELSYSQEDFDTIPGADGNHGFKPIQSSSEELGPEPIRCWNSQGQYSVESDPNGYELDLGAVSLPSDIKSTVLDLLLENLPMWQRQKWRKPNLSLSLVIKHCWCRTEETGKTTFIPLMVILEKQVIG
ncbi:epidermal growth factor receptor substrate 15-like isoform X3 [Phyllopteryx taeniolatus]|uniref:epidermal growth factor receptor substrate 15-like isoform X3 n=1 Tax=Phyllopteryx taeniolatus TaxID=161469 RepID=UPI002AD57298|nr:epidermal growth factor receptor substrate 15-like isoform X3 [Phyllopteryx taeniolatus]